MSHIESMPELIRAMIAFISPGKIQSLNIGSIHYGDQNKILARNTVCFEPDTKVTTLTGANRLVSRTFRVFVFVYSAAVTSPEINREDSDKLAQNLEDLLNTINDLDGQLLHSMVTENQSGYSNKDGQIVRSARITFEATTRSRLP